MPSKESLFNFRNFRRHAQVALAIAEGASAAAPAMAPNSRIAELAADKPTGIVLNVQNELNELPFVFSDLKSPISEVEESIKPTLLPENKEKAPKSDDIISSLDYDVSQVSPELVNFMTQSLSNERLHSETFTDVPLVFELQLNANGEVTGFTNHEQGQLKAELDDLLAFAQIVLSNGAHAQLEMSLEVNGGKISRVAPMIRLVDRVVLDGTTYVKDSIFTYDSEGQRQQLNPIPGIPGSQTGIWRARGEDYQKLVEDTKTALPEGKAILGQTAQVDKKTRRFVIIPRTKDGIAGAEIYLSGFASREQMFATPTAEAETTGRISKKIRPVVDRQLIDAYRQNNPDLSKDIDFTAYIPFLLVPSDGEQEEGAWLLVQDENDQLSWIWSLTSSPIISGPRAEAPIASEAAITEAAWNARESYVLDKMKGNAPEGATLNYKLGFLQDKEGRLFDYGVVKPGDVENMPQNLVSEIYLSRYRLNVIYLIDKKKAESVGLNTNMVMDPRNIELMIDQNLSASQKENLQGHTLVVTQVANFDSTLAPSKGSSPVEGGENTSNPNYPDALYYWDTVVASALSLEEVDATTIHIRIHVPDAAELGYSVQEHMGAGFARAILAAATSKEEREADHLHDGENWFKFFLKEKCLKALRFAVLKWKTNPLFTYNK